MALISCQECGAQMSSTAVACPQCGAKVPKSPVWPWVVGVPVGIIVLFLLWGASIPAYKSEAIELRNVCEKVVGKLNPVGLRECDAIYDRKMREGREREDAVNGKTVPSPARSVELPLSPSDQERAACANGVEQAKTTYETHMKRREFKAAADSMKRCASLLEDPFLQKMVAAAESKSGKAKRQ